MMIKFFQKQWVRNLIWVFLTLVLFSTINNASFKNTTTGFEMSYIRPYWIVWMGIISMIFALIWVGGILNSDLKTLNSDLKTRQND